jgi:hypothetical protein
LREGHLQERGPEVDGELPLRALRVKLHEAHEHLACEVALDAGLVNQPLKLRLALERGDGVRDSVRATKRCRRDGLAYRRERDDAL